jgi:hypothetical protein
MASFRFERWRKGGVFSYRFVSAEGDDEAREGMYREFVWELCRSCAVYAIPGGEGAFASEALGAEFDLVKWDFALDTVEGPRLGEVLGFLPVRIGTRWHATFTNADEIDVVDLTQEEAADLESLNAMIARVFDGPLVAAAPIRPPGWRPEWSTRAALYPIENIMALAISQQVAVPPARQVTVFAIPRARHDRLVQRLLADIPPRVQDLLDPGELLISLTIGEDIGYRDVILVQSTTDIGDRVDSLAAEVEARVQGSEPK